MKIGIGIDTGGTCTDAIIYRFENGEVLAYSKTATTKEDLSKGIGKALQELPKDLVDRSEVIALSTTLATNACVENKGGRAKLIFFGVNPDNVRRTGAEYGLTVDDSLIFINSRTKISGEIVKEPDWERFKMEICEKLSGCDAVAVVEMFAQKTGARLERKARQIIGKLFDIPVVCGHELFADNNIVKRGASTLLNARLLSLLDDFIKAVKKALRELDIKIPFVIVRSDGSLMNEAFAKGHPIETLLCGPVASVMGAAALTKERNCVVVDMGGTTTDIAFVKNGIPKTADNGVQIGRWGTFVRGLFVDTFALGGDSGVTLDEANRVMLQSEKVLPMCMAASMFPQLKQHLREEKANRSLTLSQKEEVYVGIKDIAQSRIYTEEEKEIAALLFSRPMSLEEAGRRLDRPLLRKHLDRLLSEGVLLRCGLTPTDAMHVLGDFVKYDREGAELAVRRMARIRRCSPGQLCKEIYDAVKEKLYVNLTRILLEDLYPEFGREGMTKQLLHLIRGTYEKQGTLQDDFLQARFTSSAALVSVGAPTHLFLPDVGKMLCARVLTPKYAMAANALGAVVGNVCAQATVEVRPGRQEGGYMVFGCGERHIETNLQTAKVLAREIAQRKALEEAIARGAGKNIKIEFDETEDVADTDFGPLYMGYKVTALARGEMDLIKGEDHEKRA